MCCCTDIFHFVYFKALARKYCGIKHRKVCIYSISGRTPRNKTRLNVLCSKATAKLKALYRLRSKLSSTQMMILYNSFIISIFNYCPVVWMFCGKTANAKMQQYPGGRHYKHFIMIFTLVMMNFVPPQANFSKPILLLQDRVNPVMKHMET